MVRNAENCKANKGRTDFAELDGRGRVSELVSLTCQLTCSAGWPVLAGSMASWQPSKTLSTLDYGRAIANESNSY